LKHGEADEEGWITVTRVKKNKGAPLTEAEADRVKKKEDQKKKKKVGRHFDRSCYFYPFFFLFPVVKNVHLGAEILLTTLLGAGI
jgi:hypothetical protein